MKIIATIAPRRDGTIKLLGIDGQNYTFKPDDKGIVSADVPADVGAAAIATGHFVAAPEAKKAADVKTPEAKKAL